MSPPPRLPDGLAARAPKFSDAADVTAVIAACEADDLGRGEIDVEDVRSDWQRESFDLEKDAVVILAGEQLIAQAEVFRGWRAEANVHPAWQGKGIGAWLLTWTENRARVVGSQRVGQTLSDTAERAIRLLREAGYDSRYTAWVLRIENAAPPASPELPEGAVIRDFVPGEDDRAVFHLIDDAFNEWADREPSTFGDWSAKTIGWPGFEPWHLPVAVLDDEIVGAAHLIDYDNEGWIGQLAVQRQARGRGIARALLQHSFEIFFARGKETCGLSTDSRTGALGLYERVGMHVTRSYTHHAKTL